MQYTSPKVHERVQVFNEQLQAAAEESSPGTKVVTSPETAMPSTSSAIAAIVEAEEPETKPEQVTSSPVGV
mgnify:CR=1 FL=1